MRIILVIASFAFGVSLAQSNEPASHEPVPWGNPFEPISGSHGNDALVLILITNEDPFVVASTTNEQALKQEGAVGRSRWKPPVWCADMLERAYREAVQQRTDLRGRLVIQSIAAGLPRELTDGNDGNTPARAVLAICDGQYQLLSVLVGVPDTEDLLTLIEDAEDVATVCRLEEFDRDSVSRSIAQRNRGRMGRLWRGVLDESIAFMKGDHVGVEAGTPESEHATKMQIRLLAATYAPIYLADVRLRFGFTEERDENRLVIMEQHPETRRPWCDAMMPLVAGCDFAENWRTFVELIWEAPPITAAVDAKDLIDWFDLHIKTDSVVLWLSSPDDLQAVSWPPIVESGDNRIAVAWQRVHTLATHQPFRMVDAQQLAVLIHSRALTSVNLRQPTVARYLFIEPGKKSPYVVREGDPPGRFAGILRRSQPRFVKE